MRSVFREDAQATPAELTYGEPLLEELLVTNPNTRDTPAEYVSKLRSQMANLRPKPASRHGTENTFMFMDLKTCSHAFLRDDTSGKSLQPPYTGPYKIVERADKVCILLIKGRQDNINIDCLKPAYILPEEPVTQPQDHSSSSCGSAPNTLLLR
ncbi:uncharacterized protein [Bemisia tabaci]|uniref:uncharacterized protein n=1 Tax=Bemisia tabaci TaxID=7038 RepID=UPI003B287FE8